MLRCVFLYITRICTELLLFGLFFLLLWDLHRFNHSASKHFHRVLNKSSYAIWTTVYFVISHPQPRDPPPHGKDIQTATFFPPHQWPCRCDVTQSHAGWRERSLSSQSKKGKCPGSKGRWNVTYFQWDRESPPRRQETADSLTSEVIHW